MHRKKRSLGRAAGDRLRLAALFAGLEPPDITKKALQIAPEGLR